MQVFQSVADIIIMSVIAIAYIITFIAQRNLIKSLRQTVNSHAQLTNSLSTHIATYKSLFNVTEMDGFIKMKIEAAVTEVSKGSEDLKKNYDDLLKVHNKLMVSCVPIIGYIYCLYKQNPNMTIKEREEILQANFKGDTYGILSSAFKILDKQ